MHSWDQYLRQLRKLKFLTWWLLKFHIFVTLYRLESILDLIYPYLRYNSTRAGCPRHYTDAEIKAYRTINDSSTVMGLANGVAQLFWLFPLSSTVSWHYKSCTLRFLWLYEAHVREQDVAKMQDILQGRVGLQFYFTCAPNIEHLLQFILGFRRRAKDEVIAYPLHVISHPSITWRHQNSHTQNAEQYETNSVNYDKVVTLDRNQIENAFKSYILQYAHQPQFLNQSLVLNSKPI